VTAVISVVFEYEAEEDEADDFVAAYGPGGEWARFFDGAEGYLGTELSVSLEEERRFLVIDRWESAEAYDGFLDANREEYERRSRDAVSLYRSETLIGSFERVDSGTES
jgi:heme-degrading monooxygenase HmoA